MIFSVGDTVRIKYDSYKRWNPVLYGKPMRVVRVEGKYVRLSCKTFRSGAEFTRDGNDLEIMFEHKPIVEILNYEV